MKKAIAILSALLLLGAGCTSSTTTQTSTTATTPSASTSAGATIDATTPVADVGVSATITMNMDAGNFFFSPKTVTAKAGQKVSITFKNVDGTHTFAIDKLGLKQNIQANGTVTFTAPTAPGSYPYYCSVGSHRSLGMEGTLIVE